MPVHSLDPTVRPVADPQDRAYGREDRVIGAADACRSKAATTFGARPQLVVCMPFLLFLIVIGIVVVTIQKIAEDAPIAGITCVILVFLIALSIRNLSYKKKALQEATRRAIISEFKWTDDIDPLEFERRCAEAMQLSGWTALTTRSTGDQGVDVLAEKRGVKVVLQCKLY